MWLYTMFMTFTILMAIGLVKQVREKDTEDIGFYTAAMIILLITSQGVLYIDTDEKAYKQGQIDAMTNKVKYELITQPDSTKVWREKE